MSRRKNRRPAATATPLSATGRPTPTSSATTLPETEPHTAPQPPAEQAPAVPGFLIGGLVALVTARSLVAGEDPGRLRVFTDSSGVLLAVGAWLLALATGIWWAWRRPPIPRGWVAWSAIVLLVVLLAESALWTLGYRHAALLGGWEMVLWPMLVGTAWLIASPTAVGPEARHAGSRTADRLLAALLATGVSAAVAGLIPAIATRLHLPIDDPPAKTLDYLRLGGDDVLAPRFDPPPPPDGRVDPAGFLHFSRGDTLAGWLLLVIPAVFVAASLTVRGIVPRVILLIVAAALALSLPSGVTWLALPIAAFAIWDTTRRWGSAGPGVTAGGLATSGLALVLGVGLAALLGGLAVTTFWASGLAGPHRAAVGMWRERPWLGVGPEQFPSLSRKYLGSSDPAPTGDAVCLPLDLLAAGGALALIAAILAVGVYLWTIYRSPSTEETSTDGTPEPLPWAFYVGGAGGLMLGFVLRVLDRVLIEEPRVLGVAIVIISLRALAWFAAFAWFEGIAWGPTLRRRVVLAGLLAVLIFSIDSSAGMLPALAWPVCIAVGLGLAGLPLPAGRGPSANDGFRWAVPAAVSLLLLGQIAMVAVPETRLAFAGQQLRSVGPPIQKFRDDLAAMKPEERQVVEVKGRQYVDQNVFGAMRGAMESLDSPEAGLWAEPIGPKLERAHMFALRHEFHPLDLAWRKQWDASMNLARQTVNQGGDPYGTDGLRTELFLRIYEVRNAAKPDEKARLASAYRNRVQEILKTIGERDPSAVARTTFAWFDAVADGDREGTLFALPALATDLSTTTPPAGRLTAEQRRRLDEWMNRTPAPNK